MSNNVTGNVSVCDINRVHSDWLAKCDAAVISAQCIGELVVKQSSQITALLSISVHQIPPFYFLKRIERCVKYKISAL